MKFEHGEFFLLPSENNMIPCKVSSINKAKDKVQFVFDHAPGHDNFVPQDEMHKLYHFLGVRHVRFSVAKFYNQSVISTRCSEICHYAKRNEVFNLLYT